VNPRTTGVLLLIAAALGAFLYFYEIGGEDARREAEEATRRLFPDLEPEDLTSIAFRTRDGVDARIERRDGAWMLVEPVEFPGDAFATDGLADTLATITSEAVLEDPQGPEEYGLDDAAARVVRFEADDASYELRLGNDAPVGSATYASTGASDAIYTVSRFRANSFDKSLDDLREKRILQFDRSTVARIEARWPDGAVVLERELAEPDEAGEDAAEEAEAGKEAEVEAVGAGPWRLVSPVEARADQQTVDGLLSDLEFLRANGFVDAPDASAAAGFDPPAFEVLLYARAGGEPIARLAVGGEQDDARLVRADRPTLYKIAAARLDDFPRDVMDYRFKELASFSVTDAQRMDLYFQPKTGDPVAIAAQRGDGGWTSTPEKMAPEKIAEIVSQLSNLRASGILADDVGADELAELGLSPPKTIITVFGAPKEGEDVEEAASPVLAEIQFGAVRGSEWILARAAGDPTVYELDYALAEHVPVTLEAFRNRFVVGKEEAEAPPPLDPQDLLSPTEESP
jgi:hypothetical protein